MKIANLNPEFSAQLAGGVTLGSPTSGDVSGGLPGALTVVGLDGIAFSGSPANTDLIQYNGSNWVFVTPASLGIGLTVDDEGTPLATAATTLDFVGAGVTASGAGATKTITIPGTAVEATEDHGNLGATETLDLATATWHSGVLNADCAITVTGFTVAAQGGMTVKLVQDGTGGWAVTWDADIVWIGDNQPGQAAADVTLYVLTTDEGDSVIYGVRVGGLPPTEILDIPTAETDTTLVLAPDGVGGVEFRAETGSGNVATDPIWDAAGDLAVGSGANTAAKLTKGNAGGYLAMGNGAVIWNAGTAFPASKATNDRYWRTDLGLEFFWDGTRWVTTQQYVLTMIPDAAMPMTAPALRAPFPAGVDIYVLEWRGYVYLQGTNNGTNYWTFQLKYNLNASATNLGGTTNTSAMAIGNFIALSVTAIDTAVAAANAAAFEMAISKTLSPTSMYVAAEILYRVIGT